MWITPSTGSQESTVHGLLSSIGGETPVWQVPAPLQVSSPLQTFPSLHAVPARMGVWATPVAGSQESVVQGFPSSRTGAVPAWQVPAPSQASSPLQVLLSAHEKPAASGVWTTPEMGSQESAVQGFPSSTCGGVPG